MEIIDKDWREIIKATSKSKYDFDWFEKVRKSATNAYNSGFYLGQKEGLRRAIDVVKKYSAIDMSSFIRELEEMLNE